MRITIKNARTDEEFKGKAYVHWSCWQDTYPGMVDDGYLAALTLEKCEQLAYKWRDNILVAKDGEKVVGFAGYGKSDELPDCGEVYALYVLADYRGRGVGSRLFDAALGILKEYPKKSIWVLKENKNAIAFYQKHGFAADGTEKTVQSIKADGIRMIRNDTR